MPNFTFTFQFSVGDEVYFITKEKLPAFGQTHFIIKGTIVNCRSEVNSAETVEVYDITLTNGGYTNIYASDIYGSIDDALAELKIIIENT
jgi:hypothetical protein